MIIFPSAITEVCNLFKIPPYLQDQSSVLAALIPWTLTVEAYTANRWRQVRSDPYKGAATLNPELFEVLRQKGKKRKLLQTPLFSQGLRIHKFDADIYDFLTRASRSYCVWHTPADGALNEPGYETRALISVLDDCNANNVGYKADVRVIFVHIGALPTLRKLQALAMRRCKQIDLRIYSYGTHATVPPDRWGLREIYPVGASSGVMFGVNAS